jgi:hypothetical protein
MRHMLKVRTLPRGPGEVQVTLDGEITEHAGLGDLKGLSGHVIMDLALVSYINSEGVRQFLHMLERLSQTCTIDAERCSPAIVAQINMVPNMARHWKVRSILLPLECPNCDHECEVPYVVLSGVTTDISLPQMSCEECGTSMELSEPVERYFAFLLD